MTVTLQQAILLKNAGFEQGEGIKYHMNMNGVYWDYKSGIKTGEEMCSAPCDREMFDFVRPNMEKIDTTQDELVFHFTEDTKLPQDVEGLVMGSDLTEMLVNACSAICRGKTA